jgi:hypothetical protein
VILPAYEIITERAAMVRAVLTVAFSHAQYRYGNRTSATGELALGSRIWDLGFSPRLLTPNPRPRFPCPGFLPIPVFPFVIEGNTHGRECSDLGFAF